tara:strand:+ start:775 stop:1071 length:297 start_codon:yes stop_codon:yes gene_type:complete
MKVTINETQFIDKFMQLRPNNFSYDGLIALFEWLEQYEEDTETEMELDVIGICCDFSEYDNLKEFQEDYGKDYESIEEIENETLVIPIDDESFIIQQF